MHDGDFEPAQNTDMRRVRRGCMTSATQHDGIGNEAHARAIDIYLVVLLMFPDSCVSKKGFCGDAKSHVSPLRVLFML
jgi:hypothetical protein